MPVELLQVAGNLSLAAVMAIVLFYVIREYGLRQEKLINKMIEVISTIGPALGEIGRFMESLDARMAEQKSELASLRAEHKAEMASIRASLERIEGGKKAKTF